MYVFTRHTNFAPPGLLLEIGFVEEIRTTWGSKEVQSLLYTIPLIYKNAI